LTIQILDGRSGKPPIQVGDDKPESKSKPNVGTESKGVYDKAPEEALKSSIRTVGTVETFGKKPIVRPSAV